MDVPTLDELHRPVLEIANVSAQRLTLQVRPSLKR